MCLAFSLEDNPTIAYVKYIIKEGVLLALYSENLNQILANLFTPLKIDTGVSFWKFIICRKLYLISNQEKTSLVI